jgi:molybdopterin synthase catalytic subunit
MNRRHRAPTPFGVDSARAKDQNGPIVDARSEPTIEIRIQIEPIDVAAEYAAVAGPHNGGRCLFTGCVRPEENGRAIDRLDYEHYEGMAQSELRKLAEEACRRWGLNAVRIVHRVGPVPVGAESVVIVTAAGHRAEAFEAARFAIEELKKKVPIWKSAPK